MLESRELKERPSSRVDRKENGDIYDYDPIKGYETNGKLYDTEVADQDLIENPFRQQYIGDTLDEKVNSNPK